MITGKIPRFSYGAGFATIFQLTLPAPPWRWATKGLGGSDEAVSGVEEAFIQRRDLIVHVPIRLLEVNVPALFALIAGTRDVAGQLLWYPDVIDTPGLNYQGYLRSPAIDEEFSPTPGDYPGTLAADLTLRLVGAVPNAQYYATPAI